MRKAVSMQPDFAGCHVLPRESRFHLRHPQAEYSLRVAHIVAAGLSLPATGYVVLLLPVVLQLLHIAEGLVL